MIDSDDFSLAELLVGDLELVHELTGASPEALQSEETSFADRCKIMAGCYIAIRARTDPEYTNRDVKAVPVIVINRMATATVDSPLATPAAPSTKPG